MKPLKPLYLNTYGKQKRQISAWISPDDRKKAFDSTASSDGCMVDVPQQKETSKKKTTVGRSRAMRTAKEKALRFLIESSVDDISINEGNTLSSSCTVSSKGKTSVCRSRSVRTAKEKALKCLTESSVDDVSINGEYGRPSSSRVTRRRKTLVSNVRASMRRAKHPIEISTDEENIEPTRESLLVSVHHQNPVSRRTLVNTHSSSARRFVTRRRRGQTSKPSVSKANMSRLSNPLCEISLNDLDHPSLTPCSKKPLFCSTPSAASVSKSKRLEQFLSSNPVSYIQDLSPCQRNSISPSHVKEKLQNKSDVQQLEDPSADLFLEHTTGSRSEDPKTRNRVESTSVHLLSTDGEGNSQFVSAAAELDWLIEDLKRQCLTEDCEVHLERLDYETVAQLCSQTGYYTFFEHSSQQASKKAEIEDSVYYVTDSLQKGPFSSRTVDLVGRSTNISNLDAIQLSAEVSSTKISTKNDMYQHENSKIKNLRIQNGNEATSDIICLSENGGRSLSKSSSCLMAESPSTEADRLTAALTARLKEECANRKCSLSLKRTCPLELQHATDVVPRKKMSLAEKKKSRAVSTDKPGTARKACVSGMSVNRWKTKDSRNKHMFIGGAALMGQNKSVDCSINDLIPKRSSHTQELYENNLVFSTPLRTNRLLLSPLLANMTPGTPTWSRLKAALSLHRKVMLTPKFLAPGSPVSSRMSNISQDLFSSTIRTPAAKRLQLLSQTSLDVCDGAELSDAEKVCAECGQQQPLPWEKCILPERMKRCVKIGEGTFGEVFSMTNSTGDKVALKIIPLEGSETVNGEEQKTFGEILHEIIISKELSSLKEKQHNQTYGFIGLNDLHCVQGCYPPDFINAWDTFDQRKGSENDRPDFFEKDQLFLILEFEFGGVDLENSNGTLASLAVAKSILHQVTASLAVAEEELHFEHRDLHWGNVLVKPTKQKKGSFLLNGTDHCIDIKGVLVRIIDYSLSRLEIDDLTVSCDISNDEELFMGQGDYQFEIYRLMRNENGNNWSNYRPHTNVLWLHYLCSKLLSMKYRNSGGKTVKEMRKELTRFHDNVLDYSSATEVLQNCPLFQ